MEKIWFCHSRLFTAFALIFMLAFSLHAAEVVEKVQVEVEVPVEGGDEASALKVAQERAFQKAYAKILPANMDPESREKKIKSAANFVKSFELISKKQVGENLQVTYTIEVSKNSTSTGSWDPYRNAQYFEVTWKSSRGIKSSAELIRYLEKTASADLQTIKMTGTSWWLAISSSSPSSELRQRIQSFVENRGEVRVSQLDTGAAPQLSVE